MRECQCGYIIETSEFEYCPKCGDKIPETVSSDEYVTPDNLTVPRLKRIIERSEQPVRLRVHTAVNDEFEETPPENATALLIYGIDPEDGLNFPFGLQGGFVGVAPNLQTDPGADLFEETWVTVEVFAMISVKPLGFFDAFSYLDAVNKLNHSSFFGAYQYTQDISSIGCQYAFPLFGATTEEEVQKILQTVYLNMMGTFASVWERVKS